MPNLTTTATQFSKVLESVRQTLAHEWASCNYSYVYDKQNRFLEVLKDKIKPFITNCRTYFWRDGINQQPIMPKGMRHSITATKTIIDFDFDDVNGHTYDFTCTLSYTINGLTNISATKNIQNRINNKALQGNSMRFNSAFTRPGIGLDMLRKMPQTRRNFGEQESPIQGGRRGSDIGGFILTSSEWSNGGDGSFSLLGTSNRTLDMGGFEVASPGPGLRSLGFDAAVGLPGILVQLWAEARKYFGDSDDKPLVEKAVNNERNEAKEWFEKNYEMKDIPSKNDSIHIQDGHLFKDNSSTLIHDQKIPINDTTHLLDGWTRKKQLIKKRK